MRQALLLVGLIFFACAKPKVGGPVVLSSGDLTVTIDPATGAYDVSRAGQLVFQHAIADVLFETPEGSELTGFNACEQRSQSADGAFTCTTRGMELSLALKVLEGKPAFTAQLTATNKTAATLTVLRLAPLVADPAYGGALWLGAQPERHRVLENGQFLVLDQAAQLNIPTAASPPINAVLPIPLRGSSVANWNHIVTDLDGTRSLVAGYLTFDHSIPTLGLAPLDTVGADGRRPFSYAAESALIFHGKPLAPGQSIVSEVLYVEPLPAEPLAALERYAVAVADHKHITPWPKRGADHVVPNGWNSWSGGDSTGGYGHDIDETLIKANLAVYTREFKPFGASYFQIDDGWQHGYGDWTWKADTFPSGGAGMASFIADQGFKPGLWIGPFSVSSSSPVAVNHADWLQPREDGGIGLFGKDRATLDLTNPAVRDYVRDTFTDFKNAGWKWAKVDFSYFDLLGKPQFDPTMTNVEAWSSGWQLLRDTLGPDVFVVGIGIMGTNIGRVDGMRLTNDDGPRWEDPKPDDALESSRSFKETVRVGSRRWFYQNRIWVNHNDLLYFRSDPDPQYAPLTFNESRTFASWVGLGGGIVKLGDRILDLADKPEQIDVLRRLLPSWPDGARPLDVMTRDFPEQHLLHVSAPAGEWDVLGLFNWGTNRDWSTQPPTPMPEAARSFPVSCADCLAYEFWSEQFLGRIQGSTMVSVEPREAKLIALRPYSRAPQFLGSNRHITQGANDMGAVRWDAGASILSGTLLGAVGPATTPFEYRLAFYVPDGFHMSNATVEGAIVRTETVGPVVRLKFVLPPEAQGQKVKYSVSFQ